jgi:hypothetical protein
MPAVSGGKLGDCTLSDGHCPSSSCSGNSIPSKNSKNSNNNCDWQNPEYTVSCQPYKSNCDYNSDKCFGFTNCSVEDCPKKYIGIFCFFVSSGSGGNNYKVCNCDNPSTDYVSQCRRQHVAMCIQLRSGDQPHAAPGPNAPNTANVETETARSPVRTLIARVPRHLNA